jgi:hypothetical protein
MESDLNQVHTRQRDDNVTGEDDPSAQEPVQEVGQSDPG